MFFINSFNKKYSLNPLDDKKLCLINDKRVVLSLNQKVCSVCEPGCDVFVIETLDDMEDLWPDARLQPDLCGDSALLGTLHMHERSASAAVVCQNIGAVHLQHGRWIEAFDKFTEALSVMPESALLYANRAEASLRLAAYRDAYRDALRALALGSKSWKPAYRKGVAALMLGEWRIAQRSFRLALRRLDDDPFHDADARAEVQRCVQFAATNVDEATRVNSEQLKEFVQSYYTRFRSNELDNFADEAASRVVRTAAAANHVASIAAAGNSNDSAADDGVHALKLLSELEEENELRSVPPLTELAPDQNLSNQLVERLQKSTKQGASVMSLLRAMQKVKSIYLAIQLVAIAAMALT